MKYLYFFLAFSVYLTGTCQEIIPLWPDSIPNQRVSNEEERQIQREELLWVENVQVPTLEVYLPARGHSNGNAVLIFPGGGYHGLAYDWEGTDIAKWLNANGIAAFVVKYRLPVSASIINRHEAPLQDAQRAIRIVKSKSEEWGITEKVGIIGFSAGGHLASTLGTHYEEETNGANDNIEAISARPDFMLLIYPVISFQNNPHAGSRDALLGENQSEQLLQYYSSETQVTPSTPPTILIHSSDDGAVPVENSLDFYNALREHNVPAELHIFPYGGHGYSLALDDPHLHSWTDLVIQWIGQQSR